MAKEDKEKLEEYINNLIEGMRPRLLDLTRRNPLLSTPFSERSHSNIRVIDEVPSFLFEKLLTNKMRLVPLPALEEDPRDELSNNFINAFAEARYSDEEYLQKLEGIDPDDEDSEQELLLYERELKDRIRTERGMPERQTKDNFSLQQHAKNHHIKPSYELNPNIGDDDGRHTDNDIQTLLLPDLFERRLNSISSKDRTWQQETGISVFHIAFGFLEWFDDNSSKSSFAPLLLMPASLEKIRKASGVEFYVCSEGESVENNVVLAEKLRLDYALEFPTYSHNVLIEDYFAEIEESIPKHRKWRFRRQVALGVFPSAKMAMYHDLDTSKLNFSEDEVIKTLFAGSGGSGVDSPFADDHEVDEPEIESKVPFLIADADSSQFSTIVDVIDNKNVAVEGPPGSGKSQTIVNTIASAMLEGKKVLFVAEKTAALDVVRSRLEALHLGEFILPLLANRSSRSLIIESIRERLDLNGYKLPEIKSLVSTYRRSRAQIKIYIEVLGSKFSSSGFTTHDILGKQLKYREFLERLPKGLQKLHIPGIHNYSDEKIKILFNNCEELEEAEVECLQISDLWKISNVINLNPFTTDDILENTSECAEIYGINNFIRKQLSDFNINRDIDDNDIIILINTIESCENQYDAVQAAIVLDLLKKGEHQILINFINLAEKTRELINKTSPNIRNVEDSITLNILNNIIDIAQKYQINNIAFKDINRIIQQHEDKVSTLQYISEFIEECMKIAQGLENIKAYKIFEFCYIASLSKPETLAFRSEELENPLLLDYLKKQHILAISLRNKKQQLSHCFDLDRQYNLDEIRQCLSVLSSAGIFRLLNSKYHTSKKYYKTISLNANYDLNTAAIELRELSELINKENAFTNNDSLKNIFKYTFDGINTDFQLALDTIKYYKDIEENFSNRGDQILRDYLRNESPTRIKELPKPCLDKCQNLSQYGNYQSIKDELNKLIDISKELDKDLIELKNLVEIIKPPIDINLETLTTYAEYITELQEKSRKINSDKSIKSILGDNVFNGINTNINYLRKLVELYGIINELNPDIGIPILNSLIKIQSVPLKTLLFDIRESDDRCENIISELAHKLECDAKNILEKYNKSGIEEWATSAINDREGLHNYSKLASYKKAVSEDGFGKMVMTLSDSDEGFNNFTNKVKAILFNNMAKSVYSKYGEELGKYNGMKLNNLRNRLANNDREIIKLASFHIAEQLVFNSKPPEGLGRGPKRNWTEFNLIKSEIAKKQRFISPRDLTRRAGKALLELKPCWMMSPLSVAQYIQKGDIEFDLVIIDEASQMTPENAIGAIVRSKQAMIVGDTNQLPPTNFFKKFIAIDDDEEEEDSVTEESILEIANSAFRPARRLRWHYRSRHSSLIAFSNKYIYDNDLTIYPSASENDPTMGVSLVKVDGIYSSGTNPKESEIMIDHIVKFMREHSDRSLGVVTVNQKQRSLLQEEFEYAISNNPDILDYIEKWDETNDGLESFFIKNLENVQGDERDVIFIGIVYGPESRGSRPMQRFGPIRGVAGRRRLNVLFTRAKKQIVTFSSMSAADITAEEDGNPGAFLLKQWLSYSATNVIESGVKSGREPDSEFEEYVIKQISSIGCVAVPQVGVAGYFIDIGVKHPSWPHGYILGVECDGASYHSSKSARDRDRLREEILINLGWRIYRIWSTDWFENPRKETEKLRVEIDERLKELAKNPIYISTNYPKDSTHDELLDLDLKEDISNEIGTVEDLFADNKQTHIVINKEQAKKLLLKLRSDDIEEEFENATTERGILNDEMIDIFLEKRPETPNEFRNYIPVSMRERIDYHQMIYLNSILDIIRKIK